MKSAQRGIGFSTATAFIVSVLILIVGTGKYEVRSTIFHSVQSLSSKPFYIVGQCTASYCRTYWRLSWGALISTLYNSFKNNIRKLLNELRHFQGCTLNISNPPSSLRAGIYFFKLLEMIKTCKIGLPARYIIPKIHNIPTTLITWLENLAKKMLSILKVFIRILPFYDTKNLLSGNCIS